MLMQNLVTGASVSRLPPKVPRFAMVRFSPFSPKATPGCSAPGAQASALGQPIDVRDVR